MILLPCVMRAVIDSGSWKNTDILGAELAANRKCRASFGQGSVLGSLHVSLGIRDAEFSNIISCWQR